jgi:SAM-dependent methyltransferase
MALIFLHIPRTGGTTLTRIARRQYRPDQIYMIDSTDPVGSTAALSSLPSFSRERLSLIAGHASFGVHRQVGGGRYFTLIRDPVQRVRSHYRYAQQRSVHPMHDLTHRMTLGEMLEEGVWPDLRNGQCRALAGHPGSGDRSDTDAPVLLERARANLDEHFALWGLTERYTETLLMARIALGWRHLYYAPENATQPASSSAGTGAEVEAIRRHNTLDIALYVELERKFQETLDTVVPDWSRQLVRLKAESLLDEPRRRLRSSYEHSRLRSAKRTPNGDAHQHDPAWLRRWVVGGYDWQVGQKEWIRRRLVGEYGWGRISDSFEFVEGLLRPCPDMNRGAAYDVGCGAGYDSFALASYFETVVAVDQALRPVIRAELLKRSSRIRRIRFVRDDASQFDPVERFDLVLCNLMSHFTAARLRLLHRLATRTADNGWIIYAEEAQGYAPMAIEAAIADRDVLALRTRLRQVLAGVQGDPAFRFFVAPSAGVALHALGFDVANEEFSWWRSLPTTHRIWARRARPTPPAPVGQDADYLELSNSIRELRSRSASQENPLGPLLILADLARHALPCLPEGIDARIPTLAQRTVDSIVDRGLDWCRIEDGFAHFVDAVDRSSPAVAWATSHEHARPATDAVCG